MHLQPVFPRRAVELFRSARCCPLLTLLLVTCLSAFAAPPPLPRNSPIPPTYFGLHAQRIVVPPRLQMPAAPWPTVPFGAFRLWSMPDWFQINGRPGQEYNFTALDRFVDMAVEHKVEVLFTVGHTPRWASSDPNNQSCAPALNPGGCDPPRDLKPDGTGPNQYFRDFITAVAKHEKGRINDWEMWNEPGGKRQWTGTVPQLVRMTKDMNEIIKKIDPDALIVSPAYTGVGRDMADRLSDFFKAGGGDYIDVVAFHGYIYRRPPVPEEIVEYTKNIRDALDRHGQSNKQLWDTEGGWGRNQEYPDPDMQAAFVTRMYLLQWGAGVDRYYWWTWSHYPAGTLYDIESNSLTKAGVAYKQVYDWMVGATQARACQNKGDIWTCDFTRAGGYQAQAVWDASADARGSKQYSAPTQFTRYRDVAGNTTDIPKNHSVSIGAKPILLETGAPGR